VSHSKYVYVQLRSKIIPRILVCCKIWSFQHADVDSGSLRITADFSRLYLMVGVTVRQGMLTPPRHTFLPSGVSKGPCLPLSLTCMSYNNNKIDYHCLSLFASTIKLLHIWNYVFLSRSRTCLKCILSLMLMLSTLKWMYIFAKDRWKKKFLKKCILKFYFVVIFTQDA
jgi:hypothetical protein